jgi:N-acyl-L-homoserine lactone synthetase
MNIPKSDQKLHDVIGNFQIEAVETPRQLHEVFRLRHQVYCVERGHQDMPGGTEEEFDAFDAHSRHVLLRHGADGEAVGTARLICTNPVNPDASFQVQEFCAPAVLAHIPLVTSGEISRFALSKSRRVGCENLTLMRLALVRGLVRLSSDLGITHWLALQERSLLRLNERNAIRFDPIGPSVVCHGIRQPTAVNLCEMLEGVRREQFPTWDFLTRGGTWFRGRKWTDQSTIDRDFSAHGNPVADTLVYGCPACG